MKTFTLLFVLFLACVLFMTAADYLMGARAEFLSAWGVFQRLVLQAPTAGESQIYRLFGAAGEFAIVLVVNFVLAGLMTIAISLILRK